MARLLAFYWSMTGGGEEGAAQRVWCVLSGLGGGRASPGLVVKHKALDRGHAHKGTKVGKGRADKTSGFGLTGSGHESHGGGRDGDEGGSQELHG